MKVFDIITERQQGHTALTIFDIDDTLFHTTAEIKVMKDNQVVHSLTNQEFNNYQLQPGEQFDFGEFRSAEKFAKESKPIKPMINTLKNILKRAVNTKVIMLTARADFDNKEQFLQTFEKHGIDMSRVHVHRAGNLPGDESPAYKKAIWIRKYLNTGHYNRVNLIDDSMTNLKVFKGLKQEYPTVDFDAYFVRPTGSVSTVDESWTISANVINEKVGDVVQVAEPGDTVYSIARQNNITPAEVMKLNGFNNTTKLTPGQEVKLPSKIWKLPADKSAKAPKPAAPTAVQPKPATTFPAAVGGNQPKPITGSSIENILRSTALQAGITGQELAQFLAQCAHETENFASLKEYGGSLDFRKYDIKYNPSKAKELGNKYPGDGALFKGRGYIQLTGRWNYTEAGKALGLPLDRKPQLVERPDIAAKTSIWFWKNRVRPNVNNFADTRTVTHYINKALRGLEERIQLFREYLKTMSSPKREDSSDMKEGELIPFPKGTVTHDIDENFADGKNPQDKGDSARHGIPKNASITQLKKIRSSDTASTRKKQLAHWQINMKHGREK